MNTDKRGLRKRSIGLIVAWLGLGLLPVSAQDRSAIDRLLDRIVQHEQEFLRNLKAHSPIIETYIQETPNAELGDSLPSKDHYFLGRMSLTNVVNYESFLIRTDNKGIRIPFAKNQSTEFLPKGFAQMTVLDASNLNRRTYNFDYVRREFLGDVRCLVFDVSPIDRKVPGQFVGSVWVEDRQFRIVRFNGTYTAAPAKSRFGLHSAAAPLYFHFDSWRVNVGPGQWVPAFVYVEESGADSTDTHATRFKAQSRLWGFNSEASRHLDELTSIIIDSESEVKDVSDGKDFSPLESQRSWEHQAEENIVDRLEKGGLLSPKGSVDEMLNTVVNNLIVTNDLPVNAECRVLLTTPLETFSIGHTIVISRGLLDVLPDEASLAMVLSQELAHIALGHRTATEFAFHNRMMLSDHEILQRFRFQRNDQEIAAAGRKMVEILRNSPYKQKLGKPELFLKALNSRSGRLPKLIQATVGNQLASTETLDRLAAFASQAPALQERSLEQIAALPLGSRIKVDPWTNQITLMKAKPLSLLSAREKMPFEVAPFVIHLTRTDGAPAVQATQATLSDSQTDSQ